MKKLLAVLLAVVLMLGGAGAEGIDLDGMTLDELLALRNSVNARIDELCASVVGEDGSVALSEMPHEAVMQFNDRRMEFLLLDRAKDLNGKFHPDIMYQDVSDGHFTNECLYSINEEYSRLTGEAFFGYVKENLGNCPELEIRGDGAILYIEEFDAHAENAGQVHVIDIDITGYRVISVALSNSAEHGFYLSNMRLIK